MVARVVGASEVRLLDISRRGVLLETQTRLQFRAKATIHFTTCDASISVRAQVVRSLVASVDAFVVYHTALTFDEELRLADALAHQQSAAATAAPIDPLDPVDPVDLTDLTELTGLTGLTGPTEPADSIDRSVYATLDPALPFARDGSVNDDNGEILLNDELNLLVTLDDDLETLQRRADAHGDD
jgi:hypothetical protein